MIIHPFNDSQDAPNGDDIRAVEHGRNDVDRVPKNADDSSRTPTRSPVPASTETIVPKTPEKASSVDLSDIADSPVSEHTFVPNQCCTSTPNRPNADNARAVGDNERDDEELPPSV